MTSAASTGTQSADSAAVSPQACPAVCQTAPTPVVGVLTTLEHERFELSAEELEEHILDTGWLLELAMARWAESGCFAARGEADFWRRQMYEAIAARSSAQVARMAAESDARIAREPGAERT